MKFVYRITLLIIISVISFSITYAQYLNFTKRDSLYKVLEKVNGKEKINAILALADELKTSSVQDGLAWSDSAVAFSLSLGYTEGLINAYLTKSDNNYTAGNLNKAYSLLDSALYHSKMASYNLLTGNAYLMKAKFKNEQEQFTEAYFCSDTAEKYYGKDNYIKGILDVHDFRGKIFMANGDYDEALRYFSEGIQIAELNNVKEFSASVLYCIGYCHFKKGNYDTALYLYELSIKENTKYKNYKAVVDAYNYLGDYNINVNNDYSKALINFYDAIKVCRDNGINGYICTFYTKVSHCYMILGDFKKSNEFNRIALDTRIQTGTKYLIGSAYVNTGASYLIEGKYALAEENFKKGIPMLQETSRKYLTMQAYLKLSRLYEKLKDADKALASLKMYVVYGDSLKVQNEKVNLSKYSLKYELEKKNAEFKAAELERKTKELVYYTLLIILLSFIILVIILRILNDRKQKKKLKELNITLEKIIEERTKDLEELKIAKEKAEESDRLKTAFLANLSHEIRTPMNAILGFSDLLTFDTKLTEMEKNEYTNIIRRRGKDLLAIIDDMIDIAKIESGDLKISKSPCRINEVILDLFADFDERRLRTGKKRILMEIELGNDDNFKLVTDGLRLRQILSNLIDNSLKFTERGTIKFGYLAPANGIVEFYVKDTGIGIPLEKKEVIFDRFRQLDDSHSREYGGTGLGLSIAKKIVELLGGIISVKSEPGIGAEFRFTLPAHIASSSDTVSSMDKSIHFNPSDFNWKDKSFLIAEDEESNYKLLKAIIEKTNATIVRAINGKEAIDIFSSDGKFDLILMDMRMPGIDGYQATREIRKISQSIPIIALTAYAMLDDRHRSIEAGCNEHLSKPVTIDLLIETMSKFIKP